MEELHSAGQWWSEECVAVIDGAVEGKRGQEEAGLRWSQFLWPGVVRDVAN